MLTKDEFLQLAREAGIEVHERKQQARIGSAIFTGGDSSDQLLRFAELIEARAQAATLATVTPLVQQLVEVLDDGVPHNNQCITHWYARPCDCGKKEAITAARAFLSGATKESSDVGATIEWQVRGRHHYEWRRASEEIARAMYLVNPGHVRAVTVVEGAVPKAG